MKSIFIKLKDRFISNIFLFPSLIGVLVFFTLPFIIVIIYSLVDNPVSLNFVFLDNYKALLVNDAFRLAATNTLIFFVISVPLVIIIPLLLALYFTNNRSRKVEIDKSNGEQKPKKSLLKIFFLSPMMVPIASTILIWNIIFYQNGGINEFLSIFGIKSIEWMKSDFGRFVIILLFLWKNTGYNMVLFIAGLSNVPKELLEAASIDGASNMQKFANIKLRYLSPTLLFVSIISVINSFKVFREIYLLTGNYPYEALYSLQHFMNNTFNSLDYQKLSAAAIITAIVVMIIVKVLFKIEYILGKDLDDYDDDILHKKINIWGRFKNRLLKSNLKSDNSYKYSRKDKNKNSCVENDILSSDLTGEKTLIKDKKLNEEWKNSRREANIKRDIIGSDRTRNKILVAEQKIEDSYNNEFYRRREENIKRDLVCSSQKNNYNNHLSLHILETDSEDYGDLDCDESYDEVSRQDMQYTSYNSKFGRINRIHSLDADDTTAKLDISGSLNKGKKFSKILLDILIYAIGIFFLLPILLTITNSLMSTSEIMRNYGSILDSNSSNITAFLNKTVTLKFIPDMVSLMQYNQLMIKTPEYLFKFWNSIILVVPIAILQIFVACLASYDFARSNKRWKSVIFFLYTIIMIMPYQVTLVPNYFVSDWLGLLNKRLAVILPGVFSPFSIFILTKYMRRIPKALTEAAKLDGASNWQIFSKIYIPICKGIIFSVFILVFIDYWNMIELPLILLSDENKYPLSIFLSRINTSDIGLAFAAATIYMIPTILVFAYGEDELENGIMYSGDSK